MRSVAGYRLFRRMVHWLLTLLMVIFIITGFGITEFRAVESLTFGVLTKNLAFRIHMNLWIPLIVLLGLHIFLSLFKRRKKSRL